VKKSIALLAAYGLLAAGGPARADVVTDWNDYATQAVANALAGARCRPDAPLPPGPRPLPATTIDLAMTHLAVHDAVQAIERRYETYADRVWGASGSTIAAAAKAAHDVLVARLPLQTVCLDDRYHQYLADRGIPEDDNGVEAGREAAARIIARRANDGSFPSPAPPPFIGSTDPGMWRPTPPANAPMAVPWFGDVDRFVLDEDDRERLASKAPPRLTSRRYATDFNEVKALGSLGSATRTQAQTYLAHFYSDNPILMWNRALRAIAAARHMDTGKAARLFALANMATADALMTAWDNKNRYANWRPITAIREAHLDGNPDTQEDETWQPLINTPNYPDWTSGANSVSGAMTQAVSRFFRTDRLGFTLTSNASPVVLPPPHNVRTYTRLSRAAADMVEARMLLGFHFRFADEAGRRDGEFVARRAIRCFLRPVDDDFDGGGRCGGDDDDAHDGDDDED
jgi:hypothetical protein